MAFDILPKLVKPIHASSPKFDGVWSCQAQTDWSGPAQVGSAQSLSECSRALQGLGLGADPPRALPRRADIGAARRALGLALRPSRLEDASRACRRLWGDTPKPAILLVYSCNKECCPHPPADPGRAGPGAGAGLGPPSRDYERWLRCLRSQRLRRVFGASLPRREVLVAAKAPLHPSAGPRRRPGALPRRLGAARPGGSRR